MFKPTTKVANAAGEAERHGLFVLYPTAESASWDVDIVVVHGLGGDAFTTWTADNKMMWVRDFVPEFIPTARIMTFGYDSKWAFSPSTADIKDFALDLLTRLRNKRWSADEMVHPVIFICHSLGGIVCKQALLLAQAQAYYTNIFERTSAILFFGCPHRGSRVANWGTVFANFVNASTFHKPVQKGLLKDLSLSSQILADVSAAFKEIAGEIDIKTFYETAIMLPLSGPVVERDSAIIGLPTEQTIPIAANHREMVRFSNIKSERFDPVKFALVEAKEGRPLDHRRLQEVFIFLMVQLNVADYDQQLASIAKRFVGTCEWLVQQPSFVTWLQEPGSNILWLRGYAGVGKSVMTKYIITEVLTAQSMEQTTPATPAYDQHRKAQDVFLAYFFCSERNRHLQSERNILRSILRQMLLAAPVEVNKALQTFRRGYGDYTFLIHDAALWDAVKAALIATPWNTTYFVFDALDEMTPENLDGFTTGLQKLMSAVAPHIEPRRIKLLVTSRPISSIETLLDCPSIAIRSERDVRFFVQGKTAELATRFTLSPELRKEIVETICDKAKGMFLWAILAWHELCRDANKPQDFASNLAKAHQLPASLEQLYEDILNRLPATSRQTCLAIFPWLALSPRPMHSCELRFAIALGKTTDSYQETQARMISDDVLKKLCPGLIGVSASGHVQFVHSSIKDFFLNSSTSVRYRIDPIQHHSRMAQLSLQALTMPGFDARGIRATLCQRQVKTASMMLNLAELYLFLPYAATNWYYHAGLAGEDMQVWAAFQRFLEVTDSVKLFLLLACYDDSLKAQQGWYEGSTFWNNLVVPPPVHISFFIKNMFLTTQLVEHGADINAVNSNWRNAAKEYCRPSMPVDGTVLHADDLDEQTIAALIALGADVNARDRSGNSTLTRAVNDKHEERVLMLLASAKKARGNSSLLGYNPKILHHAAAMTMQNAVLEILDDPLMDLSSKAILQEDRSILGTYQSSPLEHACLFGMESIARIMMNHPRAIAAQQRLEESPARRNPTSVAFLTTLQGWSDLTLIALQQLQTNLAKERDVNRRTILMHACMDEWHDVLEHCLEHLPRSKLNMQDANGMTALHHAAKARNWYAAGRLLDAGADFHMEDNDGRTPAHTAAEAGSDRVLRVMLERDSIDFDSIDHKRRTVLHYVATWNLISIAETMIERAPQQASARDHHGRLPTHMAALFGSTAVLGLLLSMESTDVNATDAFGKTALHCAVESKVESCIDELLSREATDLNIMDRNLKSPLDLTAAFKDAEQATEIQRLLEGAGCRPGLWRPRRSYGNALDHYVKEGGVDARYRTGEWALVAYDADQAKAATETAEQQHQPANASNENRTNHAAAAPPPAPVAGGDRSRSTTGAGGPSQQPPAPNAIPTHRKPVPPRGSAAPTFPPPPAPPRANAMPAYQPPPPPPPPPRGNATPTFPPPPIPPRGNVPPPSPLAPANPNPPLPPQLGVPWTGAPDSSGEKKKSSFRQRLFGDSSGKKKAAR